MSVRFINCDLEIEGPQSVDHLFKDLLDTGVHALSYLEVERNYFANFEISFYNDSDPNSIIAEFCDVIERFGDDARATWKQAHRRTFDLGYESDGACRLFRSELKADTVRRAAALDAAIVVTIYHRDHALEGCAD